MKTLKLFLLSKSGAFGLLLLGAVLLLAILAPIVFPFDPWETMHATFQSPMEDGALFGADDLGRDVAAGIAHGAKFTLLLALMAATIGIVLGVTLGAISGYYGGVIDQVIVGVIEIFQTIPSFFLAVVLVAILEPSVFTIIFAIGIVSWPSVARLVRAEFMSLKKREFVEAAIVSGQSSWKIMTRQILPNSLSPVIVSGSLMIASAILLESSLSFMGLGDPNIMTWGYMVGGARTYLRDAWWMSTFPGLAIFMTVLAFNLIGDALNDALNPKLSQNQR